MTGRILELSLKGAVGGVPANNAENRLLQVETRPAQDKPIPNPTPSPAPVAPAKTFEGTLSQGKVTEHTWKLSDTPSGNVTINATLSGPIEADFSVTLQRWNFATRGWENLLTTTLPGAQDTLQWQGPRQGGIRFAVKAESGAGTYLLSTSIGRNR